MTGYFNNTSIYSQTISSALTQLDFMLQIQPGSDDYPSVDFDNFAATITTDPMVTLTTPVASVEAESGADAEFLLTLSAAQPTDTLVNHTVKGTATDGDGLPAARRHQAAKIHRQRPWKPPLSDLNQLSSTCPVGSKECDCVTNSSQKSTCQTHARRRVYDTNKRGEFGLITGQTWGEIRPTGRSRSPTPCAKREFYLPSVLPLGLAAEATFQPSDAAQVRESRLASLASM